MHPDPPQCEETDHPIYNVSIMLRTDPGLLAVAFCPAAIGCVEPYSQASVVARSATVDALYSVFTVKHITSRCGTYG